VTPGAQSLYRKHRPRSFADVVGQDAVVRTLRHAVERDKVHHAYLFVGSRGTGKTSMAKILASCLNCERGPTIEPCGRCDSCRSIATATSLDVIEMDAASNNSVDDIRELRESVAFAPVSGRHKVYILDEAHMLSQAAWNAFLKTLEEPPANTVFVLATTEASKVPATVVDRCHRFDFHRPTVEQIASVVIRAAQAEQIEIPPEAVAAIARSATGSFRDALGTLEQLVTYSGTQIALQDVLAVLGVADEQLLSDAFDAVASGDARNALLTVARCAEGGRDAGSFTRDLEARARELLIVQTLEGEVPAELSLTPEIDERLREQARRIGPAEVVRVLDLLGAALEGMRAGADPRTQLELALVKAAAPQTDGSSRALLARIERLEQALSATDGVQPSRPARAQSQAAPPVDEKDSRKRSSPTPESDVEAAHAASPAAASGEGAARTQEPEESHVRAPEPTLAQSDGSAHVEGDARAGEQAFGDDGDARGGEQAQSDARAGGQAQSDGSAHVEGDARAGEQAFGDDDDARAGGQAQGDARVGGQAQSDARVGEPAAAQDALDAADPQQLVVSVVDTSSPADLDVLWPAVHESVRAEHELLGAVFNEAVPSTLTDEELVLAFPPSAAFHKRKAEDPDSRAMLIETLRRLSGRRYRVSFELREDLPAGDGQNGKTPTEEEVMARLMAELDAEELPEGELQQQKGGD
jgi:DNA polymerase III subunit gamma/tau